MQLLREAHLTPICKQPCGLASIIGCYR